MRAHGIGRIVFSSACAVYGVPERVPILEDHPRRTVNLYGHSKQMIEHLLRDHAAAYGLRAVSLRYFNAAGADPEGEIGEEHDPETHLIPLALEAAAGERTRLTVNGTDYRTRDGTCIRDYVHVGDLAHAHILALNSLHRNRGATAMNLGNGTGFSVREVIEAARRVTGRPIRVREGPRRPGDPPALVADTRLARRALGSRPRHTDIHEIIATAWHWMGSRFRGNDNRRWR